MVRAEKKKRLHITGYYQGEYLYTMMREELIMYYKEYGVNKQKHAISKVIMKKVKNYILEKDTQ